VDLVELSLRSEEHHEDDARARVMTIVTLVTGAAAVSCASLRPPKSIKGNSQSRSNGCRPQREARRLILLLYKAADIAY